MAPPVLTQSTASAIPQLDGKPATNTETLPASWFSSQAILDLEKRAIFHKTWNYCTHSSRFQNPGDYYTFNITGINFFIIKSKTDGSLKAFHNVCRHRAFPVVRKDQGSSTVLGCKYHGWAYNTDGNLTKAHDYDKVEGFKMEENGLLPIHTHITPQGLVFVSFNSDPVPFETWYEGLTEELSTFDFADYEYHMSYELDGTFNWKTLMDGYNECFHCYTAHPGLKAAFKLNTYKVVPKTHYLRHFAEIVQNEEPPVVEEKKSWFGGLKTEEKPKPQKQNKAGTNDGLWLQVAPNTGINCYSPAWYSIRVLPITSTRTILQYDIYTKKGLDDAGKKEFVDFLQQVELEDYDLCVLTQKNLNQGIYKTGVLHPGHENGVLYYQGLVKDMVKEHYDLEVANGGPIDPAAIKSSGQDEDDELEGICKSLECGKGSAVEW
ncbi:putative dioxygenase subunit alpha YeaW [Candida viswanathii]|uniref:Choline monooxygenase, chloroplastic n=1 Tax=Candida viswanathii TaxID=5486 RepID=A0A367XYY4_9ASCO|nr:putative dioxygenase subunit alpha YeaW [Candida viswanathii]